jgi:signal transduction histidine kinase/DNA-binding response OmpR family regulator
MRNQLLDRLRQYAAKISAAGADPALVEELEGILEAIERSGDTVGWEQIRQQKKLAQVAHLAELGLMSASIFHEMNQPLGGIKGFAELIRDNLEFVGSSQIAEWVNEIYDQAARMHEMQGDIAAFLRREDESSAAAELKLSIEYALRLLRNRLKKYKIQVDSSIPDDLSELDISQVQLNHILVNLIGNAVDSMEDTLGGKLSISVVMNPASRAIRILIADAGTGIPKKILKHIFEPFCSSKGLKGTGLGLYIARALAEANGGKLEIGDPASVSWDTTPSTVFELQLIRTGPEGEAGAEPESLPEKDQDLNPNELLTKQLDAFVRQLQVTQRVLVVDDEAAILRVIAESLSLRKILADVAKTAEEALDLMSKNDYAVVVTDKNLPGMDGIALMKEVKTRSPNTEIIIITGYASVDSALDAIGAGAFDYIPKPFPSLAYVAEKVRGALARYDFEVRIGAMIGYLFDTCKRQLDDLSDGQQDSYTQRLQEILQPNDKKEVGCIGLLGPTALANTARQMEYKVIEADSLEEIVSLMETQEVDVVVFVEEAQGPDCSTVVKRVNEVNPYAGVFVMAHEANLKKVVKAIGAGVGDYLIHPIEGSELFGPRLDRLVSRQQRVAKYCRLLDKLKALNIEVKISQ